MMPQMTRMLIRGTRRATTSTKAIAAIEPAKAAMMRVAEPQPLL